MEEEKVWYKSKTVWGGVLAAVAAGAAWYTGIDALAILAAASEVFSLYGRFVAKEVLVFSESAS